MDQTLDITKLTDVELLQRLSARDEDTVYNEFVKRYYDDVKRECLLKCQKRKLDKHVGEQIAHDTFARVRKTKSFDGKKLVQKNQRASILGWLYRIQTNLFYDYHNAQKPKVGAVNSYLDNLFENVRPLAGKELSDKRDIAEFIFKKLSPKQKTVFLKDLEYKRLSKYYDSETLESLAKELGVEKNSIRQIRKRAIEKIKMAIDEINE